MDAHTFYMDLVKKKKLTLNQAIERINREERVIKGDYDNYTDGKYLKEIAKRDKFIRLKLKKKCSSYSPMKK